MTTAIILLLLLLLFLLWPRIMRWLNPYIQRWMARRIEKFVRNAAGMPPPPPKPKKGRGRRNEKAEPQSAYRQQTRRRTYSADEPVIPPEYAEDVEFTETVDYSSDRFTDRDGNTHSETHIRTESQVSDVEWVEIKEKGKGK